MPREELRSASEIIADAADAVGDPVSSRLNEHARQLASLAERDRSPDHGRLDRHQQTLSQIASEADDQTVTDAVTQANELIAAFRENLEGV